LVKAGECYAVSGLLRSYHLRRGPTECSALHLANDDIHHCHEIAQAHEGVCLITPRGVAASRWATCWATR
jgi:hypothetical protein